MVGFLNDVFGYLPVCLSVCVCVLSMKDLECRSLWLTFCFVHDEK